MTIGQLLSVLTVITFLFLFPPFNQFVLWLNRRFERWWSHTTVQRRQRRIVQLEHELRYLSSSWTLSGAEQGLLEVVYYGVLGIVTLFIMYPLSMIAGVIAINAPLYIHGPSLIKVKELVNDVMHPANITLLLVSWLLSLVVWLGLVRFNYAVSKMRQHTRRYQFELLRELDGLYKSANIVRNNDLSLLFKMLDELDS